MVSPRWHWRGNAFGLSSTGSCVALAAFRWCWRQIGNGVRSRWQQTVLAALGIASTQVGVGVRACKAVLTALSLDGSWRARVSQSVASHGGTTSFMQVVMTGVAHHNTTERGNHDVSQAGGRSRSTAQHPQRFTRWGTGHVSTEQFARRGSHHSTKVAPLQEVM